MKRLVLILTIFLINLMFISNVSALCEEGQIDINTASKEELDDLYGIGPVKAEEMISSRPFQSIDELIKVKGIGDITLNKIKEQGLACVDTEEKEDDSKEDDTKEDTILQEPVQEDNTLNVNQEIQETRKENKTLERIVLTTQNIKSLNDEKVDKNKNHYAIYGFIAFCILLGVLFAIKKIRYKNEFR